MMAGPPNPFSVLNQKDGAKGSAGRGRGGAFGISTPQQNRNANSTASRDPRLRGRGRGNPTAARSTRGGDRMAGPAGNTWRSKQETQTNSTQATFPPFAQLKQNIPSVRQTPFSNFGKGPPQPFGAPSNLDRTISGTGQDPRGRPISRTKNGATGPGIPVEDGSFLNGYNERYEQLKLDRAKQRERAIKDGQMADPSQPISLKQAITPVGTCTSMCPEFERVERIVQKMVDKSEKYLHPSTNSLQNMEAKMLKRFRRSAAGYDEQLPSDIRTPQTLLQTMNYLMRHVIGGPEPLGLIHKFVWDRTRSIRNDFSVQQVTQEEDVKIAVTCLERIARFHIVSLHLLSSPANEEQFDRHQEREQLNNTMLSLMYYYDDNRGRIFFPNEGEFRAYYIIFSIHDQRPDLEARVQRWPPELRNSPRVQVALELFAAAGNTWEYQGTLDAKRPNAIAQGFYTRFFNLVNSPGVSYLMACVAEIYFNHMRQTAIRSIWKGYCRYPSSQQHKNEEWTLDELTTILCFDDEDQTVKFCEEQDLEFAENADGDLYLNWGSRPVDSVAFQPSSDHSFSEKYVESKRTGRNLVAIILGLNIKEAAELGMVDRSLVSHRLFDNGETQMETSVDNGDDSLFVSDDENEVSLPTLQTIKQSPQINSVPTPTFGFNTSPSGFAQPAAEPDRSSAFPPPAASSVLKPSVTSNPFASPFPRSDLSNTLAVPALAIAPPANPFAKMSSPFSSFKAPETKQKSPPSNTLIDQKQPSQISPGFSAFTSQNGKDKPALNPFATPFVAQSVLEPSKTPPISPFSAPQAPLTKLDQSINLAPGQSPSSIKAQPAFESHNPPPSLFQEKADYSEMVKKENTVTAPPSLFPPLVDSEKNASTSAFSAIQKPLPPMDSIFRKPEGSLTFKTNQGSLPSSEAVTSTETEIMGATAPTKVSAPVPKDSFAEQDPYPSQGPIIEVTEALPTTTPLALSDISNVEISASPGANEDEQSSDVVERRLAWIDALKEAADRRRDTRSMPTTRKRILDEQEEPVPTEGSMKAPKFSKPEPPRPRKSMALSSIKPLPKLPILELVESMTARKPVDEKPKDPKPGQVDEDELLLSAARIAAESLRSGPRLLDGWSASYEPTRSAFSPGSSVASSIAFSRSQSPQSSYVNGYDIALAPDTDLGLGRTMSRTEQRIRLTGGKGLAYKPLNFTSEKSWKAAKE